MSVTKLAAHDHAKDDIVYVLNNRYPDGAVFVEGKARIERLLNEDHTYVVRFIQEPEATYERRIRPNDQRIAHSLRASSDRARDAS